MDRLGLKDGKDSDPMIKNPSKAQKKVGGENFGIAKGYLNMTSDELQREYL